MGWRNDKEMGGRKDKESEGGRIKRCEKEKRDDRECDGNAMGGKRDHQGREVKGGNGDDKEVARRARAEQ
ncbi:hypothetical protein Pmani_021437 [Petrolisthes manimaculis]|uniref:Uncharacterized protein n=1 Tax=Petrolisthes manimaculis TaxID=1843537 RepID=A0AAE1PF01_9EUCA|nr:hypothetical protein Pmani_021437 [Petrolisthes manimaculis]